MTFSPLLVQAALALTPWLSARALELTPRGYARWMAGLSLAVAAFIAVSLAALYPPVPATGMWFPLVLLGLSAAPLAGLALSVTAGFAAGLTASLVRRQAPSDAVVAGLLLTAVAPVALCGTIALAAVPVLLFSRYRRGRIPVAANDNAPLILPLAA